MPAARCAHSTGALEPAEGPPVAGRLVGAGEAWVPGEGCALVPSVP